MKPEIVKQAEDEIKQHKKAIVQKEHDIKIYYEHIKHHLIHIGHCTEIINKWREDKKK